MKDRPLQATIIDDELVVRIGVETLAFAAEHVELPIRGFDDTVYPQWKVADAAELARDVCRKLSHEAEDGSSPLTNLLDEAIIEAYEDGSTGFADEKEPAVMTIQQHAEAAAKDIASWLRLNAHLYPSVGNQSDWAAIIQLRIDEATAPLKSRIAELEGLGELMAEYSWVARDKSKAGQDEAKSLSDKINAILKGGAK